jgi:hypothetical protein
MKNKIAGKIVLLFVFTACAARLCSAAVIGEVHRRGGSANDPPRVAREPLNEDSLSFVDRTHEYNEVPEEIRGAQYIMVANDDKTVEDYAIEIVLSYNAKVYLFLDNRLGHGDIPGGDPNLSPDIVAAEMYWVVDTGFADTGLNIGIDESGDGDIDQWSSVYALEAPAGSVMLLQQNDPTNAGGRNMYGVAVVMSPHFLITGEDWAGAIESGTIRGMTEGEWEELAPVLDPNRETTFCLPDLYYFSGSIAPCSPEESSMVMAWGTREQADNGPITSSWIYSYPADPDLSNSSLVVTVLPPKGITQVSLTVTDDDGNWAKWSWDVVDPPATNAPLGTAKGPIFREVWNLIVLDMSDIIMGKWAAFPTATSLLKTSKLPNAKIVDTLTFSEIYKGSSMSDEPIEPPGQGSVKIAWNSWKDLFVTENVDIDPSPNAIFSQNVYFVIETKHFWGWDEISVNKPNLSGQPNPVLADDLTCSITSPVAKIRWWGSFAGWTDHLKLPPVIPDEFVIGIWDNDNSGTFDHPGTMVECPQCTPYTVTWAKGWQRGPHDPQNVPSVTDACYEFTCDIIDPHEWEPIAGTKYWLSIMAVYNGPLPTQYIWGWKTRPHDPFYNGAPAVQITSVLPSWPPAKNSQWNTGTMVIDRTIPWGMAFEVIGP